MTKRPPKRGLLPMHPGELLRDDVLPALGRSKTEIAKLLGVSRQTLYAYVSRSRIGTVAAPDDPRRSLYDAADVGRLADRNRSGRSRRAVAVLRCRDGPGARPLKVVTRCS